MRAQSPNSRRLGHFNQFLSIFTLRLDGTNRLSLLNNQSAGNFQDASENHLVRLFLDNKLRSNLRRIVYDAFGKYIVIDPTQPGTLKVRFADREPKSEEEERNWTNESVEYHSKAAEISHEGDGVKSFYRNNYYSFSRRFKNIAN